MDKKNTKKEVTSYLSKNIKRCLDVLSEDIWYKITEIRITVGCPILVAISGKRYYICENGISAICRNSYIVCEEDIRVIIELMTNSSIYSYEKFINEGYITLPGGNRVGVVGTCNCVNNVVSSVNNISSLNIRISHEKKDIALPVIDEIYYKNKIHNTLIISPPGCGKTTMLRDIARILGNGKIGNKLIVCGIIDERFEISCLDGTRRTLDVGNNNFVISGCPKNIAIPMVARSMSPDVIITDELCGKKDYDAICFAGMSGCNVIASVHGENEKVNELKFENIISFFEKIIVLSDKNGPGTIEKITKVVDYS